MTTTDIQGLIERIEAATGPDRELDYHILCRADPRAKATGLVTGDPKYTASLDAAMTLVPTGWVVEIRRYFNSDGEYVAAVDLTDGYTVGRGCHPEEELTVQSRIVEKRQGDDPTPRALCAAALKAHTERTNNGTE